MKILAVTSRFPYPLERGDKLRAHHQLRELARHHEVVLAALSEGPVPAEHRRVVEDLGIRVHVVRRSRARTLMGVARAAVTGVPLQVGYFRVPPVEAELRRILEVEQPDRLYLQLIRTAWLAEDAGVPTVLDFQDAFAAAMARRAGKQPPGIRSAFGFEARRIGRYEARAMAHVDRCVVISEQDRRLLEVPDPDAVTVVPNGVDTGFFAPDGPAADPVEVGFVGNMGYPPNVRAARMLAEEVMPIVRRSHPGARLLLAGARPSRQVRALAGPSVEVTGWMDDIRTAYRRSTVMVAPLSIGAGQQNKILEAMASGVPCVTTALVNNAIGATDGTEVLLASDAAGFARRVVELLDSPERRDEVSRAALSMVRERFSWPRVGEQLSEVLQSAGEAPRRPHPTGADTRGPR